MYLIARMQPHSGRESDWLVAVSPATEQIQVTRTRQNARRFKSESDARAVRDKLARTASSYTWRVV
ncbi:MAG: hypothetical protein MI861_01740, partial [Pirellulales bacterium]|nr:hypothetical protein [Pirellulales bacterium]